MYYFQPCSGVLILVTLKHNTIPPQQVPVVLTLSSSQR